MTTPARAIGTPLDRFDGPEKVTGTARYAFEHRVERPAYLHPVQATIAVGRIVGVDTTAALAEPGVLAVLTHQDAPRVASTEDLEVAILQDAEVRYRGQFVGGVVAETSEIARRAADLVRLDYQARPHDVELRADHPDRYAPEVLNGGFATDSVRGDPERALSTAAVRLDATYTTPRYQHNQIEPHSTIAVWDDGQLTLYVASQGVHRLRDSIATLFGLAPERIRVISPHVGGGFGGKLHAHPDVALAVLAAMAVPGRPVKLALTRQQMFSQVGYRTPTIQRIRLGADADGRLVAVAHDVVQQTSRIKEFAEQTASSTRVMYAAATLGTTHRMVALDVPVPTIMRAPGKTPGMYALESAMDEMSIACGRDPVEFRIANEPAEDPERGLPFSSRNLVACLREGARRFGWDGRDPTPRARHSGGWLVGTGVAASMYPVYRLPGSSAMIRLGPDGRYAVSIGAADLGTGTWTTLTQIAADALDVPVGRIELRIGDTLLPPAMAAGGSSGMTSWGCAVVEAARRLRARLADGYAGVVPAEGIEVSADMPANPHGDSFAMYAFGAQFAQVRVCAETGEVRVPRLLGVFAAGRIINPKTGRSQLLGGMSMGLSMALHERAVVDPRFGHVVNHDLAGYHIATNADVGSVEVHFVEEDDPYVNPMGSKGIGELGIVGTAAAIANAVHHATGVRVRDLPITPDRFFAEGTPSRA
ncbi:xanthine dehydrogenase family protein molybdopterin-binding subunit [Plantactinospora soyae]|uniref:Xanthine dehydrogenase YagR molybdenum-binding subunit n=1 Tax=Plantactinospora soyae TaxID=1544732 RepID=A0A927R710_9ACTN|nr:xanthine dehydrogenase family protein molybdopterin-binding subunit [Plantactinospora soyae]MBE1488984.1 xanthine dehydrogenase YagR molybdenum-binding subunit [Plantactinospora soyae]